MPHVSNVPENSDKIVHLLVYVFFVFLWFGFFYLTIEKQSFKGALLKSVLLAVSYGILIEILQGVATDSRSADFNDLLANCIGVLVGVFLIFLIKTPLMQLKSKF